MSFLLALRRNCLSRQHFSIVKSRFLSDQPRWAGSIYSVKKLEEEGFSIEQAESLVTAGEAIKEAMSELSKVDLANKLEEKGFSTKQAEAIVAAGKAINEVVSELSNDERSFKEIKLDKITSEFEMYLDKISSKLDKLRSEYNKNLLDTKKMLNAEKPSRYEFDKFGIQLFKTNIYRYRHEFDAALFGLLRGDLRKMGVKARKKIRAALSMPFNGRKMF